MFHRDVSFFSDDLKLRGRFWAATADERAAAPQPLVIICSGFTGLMHIHPERFARFLTPRGLRCFGFDYRGFGESEGVRGRVLLEEQVRDIRAAAAFAALDERVDAQRLVFVGWGMGAGLVLDAARELPGVAALVAANGFYDGRRFQLHHRGGAGLDAFRDAMADFRRRHVRTGEAAQVDPFDLYPLDEQSRQYVDAVLRKTPGYEAERYSYELGESILRWNVEALAGNLAIPLLIVHGDQNRLHPIGEAESLHQTWSGSKHTHWIKGAGHTDFMHDNDPRCIDMMNAVGEWIEARLRETGWT